MGKDLVETILASTGLPDQMIRQEFSDLLKSHGLSEESLTLQALRDLMSEYMQQILLEAREHHSSGPEL